MYFDLIFHICTFFFNWQGRKKYIKTNIGDASIRTTKRQAVWLKQWPIYTSLPKVILYYTSNEFPWFLNA